MQDLASDLRFVMERLTLRKGALVSLDKLWRALGQPRQEFFDCAVGIGEGKGWWARRSIQRRSVALERLFD